MGSVAAGILDGEVLQREDIIEELCAELAVGDAHIMTVSWRRRLASISGAAGGLVR